MACLHAPGPDSTTFIPLGQPHLSPIVDIRCLDPSGHYALRFASMGVQSRHLTHVSIHGSPIRSTLAQKKVSRSDDHRTAASEYEFVRSELLEEDTVPRQFPNVPVERQNLD